MAVNKPEGFDFRGTKGVVTYVRFPEGVTATNLTPIRPDQERLERLV